MSGPVTGPLAAEYPSGGRVRLDARTRVVDSSTLIGGSPGRVLRLSPAGVRALTGLMSGPVGPGAPARLARRLTDAGLAHPDPTAAPLTGTSRSVAILIPVRDRPAELQAGLAALGECDPVVVVDDGSRDPAAVAEVARRHGATLIVRPVNGGPAAARNTGLSALRAGPDRPDFVLLLDSDCLPPADLVERLLPHLDDPAVAAVAPRVLGALDLGPDPALVRPGTRVGYVPTAALLIRLAALDRIGPFDENLRYGEDVDLVWRLVEAGWRVRYEPAVTVDHRDPPRLADRLGRRFAYGTSAGPLARRHPGTLAPLAVSPWPAVAVLGGLARRPALAAAGVLGCALSTRRAFAANDLRPDRLPATVGQALLQTGCAIGRFATQFAAPLLVLGLTRPRHRVAVAALVLAAPLQDWLRTGREPNPLRYGATRVVDDVAYGAGVITGSVRARTSEPVRPRLVGRRRRLISEETP